MMTFDAVVGNPPYQEENGNTRKPPIYHLFYDVAFRSAKIATLISPARFLFAAGQTPQEWNERMLHDKHLKIVKYFSDSKDVFSSVEIKGGIAITYHNNEVDYGEIGVFTAYEQLNGILLKVRTSDFRTIKEIVSSQGIYRFSDKLFSEYPIVSEMCGKGTGPKIISRIVDILPEIFLITPAQGCSCVKMISKAKEGRIIRYIRREYLQENEFIDSYNVSLPESNGTGAFDAFSSPFITEPGMGVTDTFISIGQFAHKEEAESLLKYVKAKFVRAMLGIKKGTQHNPKETWDCVPLQDFTAQSDIDWSKSIPEIDTQLYKKYGLTEEEVSFIESMIKPME